MRKISASFSLCILLFLVLSGTTFAATSSTHTNTKVHPLTAFCYGSGCTRYDPYTSHCDTGDENHGPAYPVPAGHKDLRDGSGNVIISIDNWYSPKCGANWNVTTVSSAVQSMGVYVYQVRIDNTAGSMACYPSTCDRYVHTQATPIWSDMVNGTIQASACILTDPYSPGTGDVPYWTCGAYV